MIHHSTGFLLQSPALCKRARPRQVVSRFLDHLGHHWRDCPVQQKGSAYRPGDPQIGRLMTQMEVLHDKACYIEWLCLPQDGHLVTSSKMQGTEMLQARMRFHGKVGVIWGTIWTLLEALSCSSPREWQDRVWCWGLEVIAGDRRRASTEPE